MINELVLLKYCIDDISKIENYAIAVADTTQTWVCHHRAEILPCGKFKAEDLIRFHLYYARPASELILLTPGQHSSIHSKGRPITEEQKKKIRNALIGYKHSDETRAKMSKAQKKIVHSPIPEAVRDKIRRKLTGSKQSLERREKTRLANMGSMYYTNGVKTIKLWPGEEVPDGFSRGMRKRKTRK